MTQFLGAAQTFDNNDVFKTSEEEHMFCLFSFEQFYKRYESYEGKVFNIRYVLLSQSSANECIDTILKQVCSMVRRES